jgi:hypothetical protein
MSLLPIPEPGRQRQERNIISPVTRLTIPRINKILIAVMALIKTVLL